MIMASPATTCIAVKISRLKTKIRKRSPHTPDKTICLTCKLYDITSMGSNEVYHLQFNTCSILNPSQHSEQNDACTSVQHTLVK